MARKQNAEEFVRFGSFRFAESFVGSRTYDLQDGKNINAGAGKDCFVYIISGKQVLPVQGVKTLRARFRLWVSHQDGAWHVISYDYDLFRGA